jgi:hypothetical protein
MEDYIESVRGSRQTKWTRQEGSQEGEEKDFVEPGMKIPKSVLDGCNTSFTPLPCKRL